MNQVSKVRERQIVRMHVMAVLSEMLATHRASQTVRGKCRRCWLRQNRSKT